MGASKRLTDSWDWKSGLGQNYCRGRSRWMRSEDDVTDAGCATYGKQVMHIACSVEKDGRSVGIIVKVFQFPLAVRSLTRLLSPLSFQSQRLIRREAGVEFTDGVIITVMIQCILHITIVFYRSS